MKQNPFKNVGEIHKEWTAAGVSASSTTMHRLIDSMPRRIAAVIQAKGAPTKY